ncbi:rubrerythrin family protein [Streptomyces sp. PLAI1-29]|uniref:Rubrerythrin family protein n=2 Tax=Streptomyces zingiberis TaxID=2053010 RepID=A0ABX1BTW2_9ACTN|nr:rubrerythrin family protein [Streptomyces zingiberis]
MGGESFANASYRFFAAQAQREKQPEAATAFRRTARTELWEHFSELAELVDAVGDDESNLRKAIQGETHEAREMYPDYADQARRDGDENAAELFTEIAADENEHREAFTEALEAITGKGGRVPAPPTVDPVEVPAGEPQVTSPRTRANLEAALHGEALANASYLLYARQAERSGNHALARLFRGVAQVELREHFASEAALAGLVSDTRSNLRTAISGERYESTVVYPAYAERARRAGDEEAAALFTDIAGDERRHAELFTRVLRGIGHPGHGHGRHGNHPQGGTGQAAG